MNTNKHDFTPFDEDFEVVYIEDDPTIADNPSNQVTPDPAITHNPTRRKSSNSARSASHNAGKTSKKSGKSSPAKRISKTVSKTGSNAVKTGGKIVKSTTKGALKIVQICAHAITLVLIAWIMFLIATNFWNTSSNFGNFNTAVSERNYTLAAYLGVAACLLVFELISFLWAMTSPRTSNKIIGGRQDVGRGLFSFLVIGSFSLLASVFSELIPEMHTALTGLKQGLLLYGSLFGTLLPLCIAGIVSCLIRRFAPK